MSDERDRLSSKDIRDLRHHMREPIATFAGLMGLLAINALTGWFQPFPHVWALNLGVMVLMIFVVLLFSMEVVEEPALIRLFAALGFCWVGILFTMTLIDYTTR